MIKIKSLHIYPIKSLGGIELEKVLVKRRGFEYDRRWMLIDDKNRFISQREFPKLALLEPELTESYMLIKDPHQTLKNLQFELKEPSTDPVKVSIWDDECMAKPLNGEVNKWFSEYLNSSVQLVFMHQASERLADQRYAPKSDDQVSFADGYPVLAISQKSFDLLNEKAGQYIPPNRFRPNMILEGLEAHEEDTLAAIEISGLKFYGVKPCARCVMTTIDQKTAEKRKEPLKTLSTYRKTGHKILFGENFIPDKEGEIKVGDSIEVMKIKTSQV